MRCLAHIKRTDWFRTARSRADRKETAEAILPADAAAMPPNVFLIQISKSQRLIRARSAAVAQNGHQFSLAFERRSRDPKTTRVRALATRIAPGLSSNNPRQQLAQGTPGTR